MASMSLVPERNVWAILTTASSGTSARSQELSEFSRDSPLVALVSRSIAVSTSSSPRS